MSYFIFELEQFKSCNTCLVILLIISWLFVQILYLQYACLDSGVTREQLYAQSAAVHSRVMGLLVRQVRLKRAAEKKASFLEKELGKKSSLLETSLQELEVLQASSAFARDGKC